ncbi:MAG: triose-phosphate isomerase [Roseibium sp.]|uniref:triose-phosphate isomerase n=1 Tax=Roseibium sp. TaxID=1936156 RepID=UPI001B1AB322|nr:triose-phosphate isomerase [Roseibium sp.]MBO6511254.1 triose-phosphate isomerase [Roseibium sp.]MBO6893026.1 triose-phosphate isomerase [Roseibium sp.]MBO6932645.1 triose-phosphate isomerase [Roseibium sp.]
MSASIKPLVAGNWKMNGLKSNQAEFYGMLAGISDDLAASVDAMICAPATLVAALADKAGNGAMAVGGQDCHAKESGAHTGDISAEMLKDAGASAVIVGHSERRTDHGESDADVNAKAQAAWRAGLVAIICVGETEAERKAGQALEVVERQLGASVPDGATAENTVIAYEPVWAIGTGLTPTAADVEEMHNAMRDNLSKRLGAEGEGMRLLYGGSVKPANASELMAVSNVNGALVGGASLKATDFLGILAAYS